MPRSLHHRYRWRLVGMSLFLFILVILLIVGNRTSQRLPSLPLEPNSPTSLIALEKAQRTIFGPSFTRVKPSAGISINLPEGAGSAGPVSVVNSFNRTKTHTSESHNDSSIRWRGEHVSSGRDDPEGNLPPSGASGSSFSSHSE